MFGITAGQLNESNKSHIINLVALLSLLYDKGLITPEEFEVSKARVIPVVDQLWTARLDEVNKQAVEDNPILSKLLDSFLK